MDRKALNDILRGHIWQGHIRMVGTTWERGIYEPWTPIEDQEWLDELDRMLGRGEIIRVDNTYEIEEP
jgi:hypothetical protein